MGFTKAEAFTAQPLALSTGPRSRLRSFLQVMNTEGSEITSMMAMMMSTSFQSLRAAIPFTRETTNWPMSPRAIPRAANIPANLAMSKLLWMAAAGLFPDVAESADAVRFAMDLSFFSAADLSILSEIHLPTFLYGAQKAWRRLMGLSTMLVTVASYCTPLRS